MQVGPEVYNASLERIKSLVQERFSVTGISYVEGVLTFNVADERIKERFKELYAELSKINYVPIAEKVEGKVTLKIYPFRTAEAKRSKLPLLLLIATFATVFIDGYIRSMSVPSYLPGASTSLFEALKNSMLFTIAIMSIIGIHELGHKISAKIDGIEASLPYFIPGFPGQLPTFGAVILQRSPVVNRDDLFDLGISGPIAGFLVSLLVLYLSFTNAIWITVEEAKALIERILREQGGFLPRPLIFDLMAMVISRPGYVPFIPPTPYGFAAWLGMLVTSINMLPVWQLDGGRIFRSIVDRRLHRVLSYVSIAILLLTGYLLLAILLLFLMKNPVDIAPLDSVSPLSRGRRVALIGGMVMTVVTFVVFPSPFIPI